MAPKITIIYHLHHFHANIEKSIKSLIDQTSKDFNIIIVNDHIDKKIRNLLTTLYDDLNKVNDLKSLLFSRHLGHSYAFNFALSYVKTPYVVFAGGESIFQPQFIETINKKLDELKPEILVYGFDAPCGVNTDKDLNLKSSHLYTFLIANTMNKIFNVKFLNDNKIEYKNFKHYSMLFNIECYKKAKNIAFLPNNLSKIYISMTRNFDLYDLIDQISIVMEDDKFLNSASIKEQMEYVAIRTILLNFLYENDKKFYTKQKSVFKNALSYAEDYIERRFPKWKDNKILNSNKNVDNPKIIAYLKSFIFSPKKVHLALTKVYENGKK